MKKKYFIVLLILVPLLVIFLIVQTRTKVKVPGLPQTGSVPWVTEYYDAGWGVPVRAWNDYTHIIQFAVAPNSNGGINLLWVGNQAEINNFIASRPAGKKALVTMFGADGTYGPIMASVTSPGNIANFVTNVVNFINTNGYDGVDLDWETNVNTTQLIDLISRLRAAMPSKLITIAAGNWGGLPAVAAASYANLDQINIMCYDMDFGVSYTWHNDALLSNGDTSKQSCDLRVKAFTSLGIPNAKIGIGMPFYTRRWTGTTQPLQTGGKSSSTVGYGTLVKDSSRWQPANQKWDSTYFAEYLSIPGLNEFDSYNGTVFIQALVNWAASQGFGGYMTFAEHYEYVAGASGDARFPLSAALAAAVNGGTPPPPPPPADTTAPAVPTSLTATAISSSAINLSWQASTDNVGVTGYKIFRGGAQIATSATNSYSDSGLTAQTAYSYSVSAYDAAGNNSTQSTSAGATTQAASAGLIDSGPITISGQSNVIIENKHIHGTSGDCVSITNSSNITIRNSEIGPCGSGTGRGVYISGGSQNKVYDNYIHPEASGTGGFNTGSGVTAINTSSVTIQGNVIAWGETSVYLLTVNTASVLGNFMFQPRGCSGCTAGGGSFVQGWSATGGSSGMSFNITITNNYFIDCVNDGHDSSVCASIPSAQRTLYSVKREDGLNYGYANGLIYQNNFMVGRSTSNSGCGMTADDVTSNVQFLNNRLLDTSCGLAITQTQTGLMDGNKVLSRDTTLSNTAFIVWNWQPSLGPCNNITMRNNTGTVYAVSGGESGYWSDGLCGTVTGISPNQNNTFDAPARTLLSADSAFLTPPSIPPQQFSCVAPSPFTNNPGARCGGGGSTTPPPDTTAPTPPASLAAAAISSSAITLSWTASTDNVGVTGYKIFRGGAQIATSATNSYSDSGLTASTAYTYKVSAYDAAGNNSTQSSSASATAQAVVPVLSNLTGSNTTANNTNLSWNTNVSTNGRVFYGLTSAYGSSSALLDNTTKTTGHSVTLTNLSPSTLYHFKVTSTDGSNNSVNSSDFTFTTPTAGAVIVYIPAAPGLPTAGGAPENSGNRLLYLIIILIILAAAGFALFKSQKQPADPKINK